MELKAEIGDVDRALGDVGGQHPGLESPLVLVEQFLRAVLGVERRVAPGRDDLVSRHDRYLADLALQLRNKRNNEERKDKQTKSAGK